MTIEEGTLRHGDGQEAALMNSSLMIENANLVAHLLRDEIHSYGNIAREIQRFAIAKEVVLRRRPLPPRPGSEQIQQRLVVEQDDVPKIASLGIANDLLPGDIAPVGDPALDDHISVSTGSSQCLGEGWTFLQEVASPESIDLLGC